MTTRGHWTAVAAILTVGVTAACGVPQGGQVTPLAGDQVPYALLSPAPSDSALPPASGADVTTPRLFFLDTDEKLVPVPLSLSPSGLEPVLEGLLERLATGPTEQQRASGLGSALGPSVMLQVQEVVDHVARIDVSLPPQVPAADRLPLAVGQLVLTATSVAGVDEVQVLRNGKPVDVPLPGGARASGPVGPEDYRSLVAVDAGRASTKAQPGPSKPSPVPPSPSPPSPSPPRQP